MPQRPPLPILGVLIACSALALSASAEPTRIAVRVLSKDAKFVGTSMGGVLITLRDADTGELLASGLTGGGTGDTARIMKTPHERGAVLSTEGSAVFRTTLDIGEPVRVEVTAMGPMAQRQSANTVSATQWVVPGKHLDGGDGWLLVLPGFVVDVLQPPAHVKLSGLPKTVPVEANVTMMCGCPIEKDGLWDANRFDVGGTLKRNGSVVGSLSLTQSGQASRFVGELTVDQPGTYELIVYSHDPANGNTGLDRTTFIVSP